MSCRADLVMAPLRCDETKMTFIPIWVREAHNEGLQEGIQHGIQQGPQARRDIVLAAVAERFGMVPDSVAEGIQTIEDADRLADLVRQAIRTASVEEFQRRLVGSS
jgi:hypothetical protein